MLYEITLTKLKDWFMGAFEDKYYLKSRSQNFKDQDKQQTSLHYHKEKTAPGSEGTWRVFTKTSKGLFVCTFSMTSLQIKNFCKQSFSFSELVTLDLHLSEQIYQSIRRVQEDSRPSALYRTVEDHVDALLKASTEPEIRSDYEPGDFWTKDSLFYRGHPFFRAWTDHRDNESTLGNLVFASQEAGAWVPFHENMLRPSGLAGISKQHAISGLVKSGFLKRQDQDLYLSDKAKSMMAIKYLIEP